MNSRSLRACGYVDKFAVPPALTLALLPSPHIWWDTPHPQVFGPVDKFPLLPEALPRSFWRISIFGLKKEHPPYMGAALLGFIEQVSHLSTCEVGYPQLLAVYPQETAEIASCAIGGHAYMWIRIMSQSVKLDCFDAILLLSYPPD